MKFARVLFSHGSCCQIIVRVTFFTFVVSQFFCVNVFVFSSVVMPAYVFFCSFNVVWCFCFFFLSNPNLFVHLVHMFVNVNSFLIFAHLILLSDQLGFSCFFFGLTLLFCDFFAMCFCLMRVFTKLFCHPTIIIGNNMSLFLFISFLWLVFPILVLHHESVLAFFSFFSLFFFFSLLFSVFF